MKSAVLAHGVYTLNQDAGTVVPFVVDQQLGQAPIQYLGAFDLAPWQGTPPGWSGGVTSTNLPLPVAGDLRGVADDFRESVYAVDSGNACARFTWRPDTPPIGTGPNFGAPTAAPGSRTFRNIWANDVDPVGLERSNFAMPTLIAAADSLTEMEAIWRSVFALEWGSFGFRPAGFPGPFDFNLLGQFPFCQLGIGPDILADLAQGSVAEFDLKELAGGARFVAIWTGMVWVGQDPSFGSWPLSPLPFRIRWQIEDRPGAMRAAPVTYSYPIQHTPDDFAIPVPHVPYCAPFIIAQWSSRVANQAVVSGPVWSVSIANGGPAVTANIGHAVGTQVDEQAALDQPVAAGVNNAVCTITRLAQPVTAQFPYSFGFVSAMSTAAGVNGGPMIVQTVLS